MFTIYYGRENLDKEKFIFSNLTGRTLILVPDQYTLEAEREAFRHLGVSALVDVEILSPSRLGSRILSELGGGRKNFIDKYGRHILLYRSACRQKENLLLFKGMESRSSFLDSVNNFISEMKQYDCGPDDLKNMADMCNADSYTKKKLMDVYTLFADYEEQIKDKYTDTEDYADLYIGKIAQSQLVKGSRIWVYGFDSFAPKAMALLGQLMQTADELNLVMTYGDTSRDRDLFDLASIVMSNAETLADNLGVAYRRIAIGNKFEVSEKKEAIKHIEKELYSLPSFKSDESCGVTLVEAAGIYNEAESAASYVLNLVRDKNLRYKDIKVICNDMEGRGEVLARVFNEYGIEVFTDTKKNILSSVIVQMIISLLDVVVEKYRSDCMLKLLKAGFGDLDTEEIAELENYSIKYKIKGTMWKKPFRRGKGEYGEEGIKKIEELRIKAIKHLIPFEKIFENNTTGEFIKDFYNYLCDELKLKEKILLFSQEQEKKGLTDFADETIQTWDSIVTIFDQMYEIMGDETFDAADFRDIFYVGISQVEIGILPPTEDGLLLGTMQRSRTGKIKALVVVGANEGILPQEKPSQGLFSPEERELFNNEGKELCKVDKIRFMEEKMAIYRNFSSPSDYLWVSYSLSDMEGNQIKPSKIFTKLKEIFPDLPIRKDVINGSDNFPLINSKVSGLRHLTESLQSVGEGKEICGEWKQALGWFERNQPEKVERIRNALSFTNKYEELGKAAADALFRKNTGEAMSLSPSRIERFARCPFSHLVSYGLKPEERRIYEAAPREIGDVYHQCLMEVTKELTQSGIDITSAESPWMTVKRKDLDDLIQEKVEKIAGNYRDGLFNDNNIETYRGQRALEILRQVCWTMVEQVRQGNIRNIKPEVAFGRKGALPPIEINLGDRTVFVEGIIDRVDYLSDDRVKIIDYKTGNESFDTNEASSGYRLQLMMYLQAACSAENKPAGVFYFKIKDPTVDFSQKDIDSEVLEKEIRKSFKLDGIMVDDPRVITDIAGEFGGFSEIVPIRVTKEGIKNTGKEGLLSEDEFDSLQEAVKQKVKEACKELLDGKIDAHPMKTKERSACTYCKYKGICMFDTMFEGCSYNIIN